MITKKIILILPINSKKISLDALWQLSCGGLELYGTFVASDYLAAGLDKRLWLSQRIAATTAWP